MAREEEARAQLGAARDSFVEIGTLGFAERTRLALVACGAAGTDGDSRVQKQARSAGRPSSGPPR